MAGSTDLVIQMVGTDGVPYTVTGFLVATDGLFQALDRNVVATTNSPKEAKIHKNSFITDIIATSATTGTLMLVVDGQYTGIMIDLAMHYSTNSARPVLHIPVAGGKTMQFRAITTLVVA